MGSEECLSSFNTRLHIELVRKLNSKRKELSIETFTTKNHAHTNDMTLRDKHITKTKITMEEHPWNNLG